MQAGGGLIEDEELGLGTYGGAEELAEFEALAGPMVGDAWGAVLEFVGADLDDACNTLGLP